MLNQPWNKTGIQWLQPESNGFYIRNLFQRGPFSGQPAVFWGSGVLPKKQDRSFKLQTAEIQRFGV